RNPKDDETPIAAATQIFASCLSHSHVPLWKRLWVKPHVYAFEIFLINQTVYFYVTTDETQETFVASLIAASFPTSSIEKTDDPMTALFQSKTIGVGQLKLDNEFYLPTKTYADFEDIDTLAALVGFLAKQQAEVMMCVQILITPASFDWQARAVKKAGRMIVAAEETKTPVTEATGAVTSASPHYARDPQQLLIMQKASFQGGKTLIRLVVGTDTQNPKTYLHNLAGTFGIFSHGDGNEFQYQRSIFRKNALIERIKKRKTYFFEKRRQILNAQELSTIWHPPGFLMAGVKNIAWGKTLLGEPPENLPVAENLSDEEKKEINFFAQTDYKNKPTIFGIKTPDRRKHIYLMGKTGAGKTTLIANMAIDDIRKDRGVGIIDPHGDLSETILDYIPKRRLNDVVYLEPFDQERVFSLNVLEVHNKQQKDLVASGIVSIFNKIYKESWGPRLEYILRNVIMTLLEIPNATLVDVLSLLADAGYRKKMIPLIQDPVIKNFWEREFAQMPDKLKAEAVSPIQNKVGQFVSSKMIRNIIGQSKSSINLQQIMDEGKILILNLSQGKLGEDNASLLGAMIITQIQLAAMNRSFMKEEERKDFFLYVDEFQNFATTSFTKILSEARKYRLSLTLANQYMGQLEEDIQHAIFGNVGTLISFVVGATDAELLTLEFAEIYSQTDLVSLGKYEIVMKLSIDGMTSMPFPAKTLPLPSLKNENKDKIIQLAKEKYGRKVG
ncbi:MAG: type IV secretion system DNA-binding domain-containing protein, partial [Candidatus Levybacteria bacterium]|nr:type IV secretion system DNA-binding domain-containing protein [Candidatus Levybacteria bacterium]